MELHIADLILSGAGEIRRLVRMTERQWIQMIGRVQNADLLTVNDVLVDEQLWTFLVAVGYASGGEDGIRTLNQKLTGGEGINSPAPVWFEALPMPPRHTESNTNLDLAAGSIRQRGTTSAGIELEPGDGSWICFVEAKWYSDLSTKVTHHPERNQLARVIENALAFQGDQAFAMKTYVALLTPRRFREGKVRSRLYQYKFAEYSERPQSVLDEFVLVDGLLPTRTSKGWSYPEMAERLATLTLNWVTYEELVAGLPDTELGSEIRAFSMARGDR